MIKYKVKDAAADLGVSNKEIIEILEKHCGVTKKTMTTLEESELDVIFDVITKKNKVENFDEYFAARNNKLDNESRKKSPQSRMQRLTIRRKRPINTTKSLTIRTQSLHQNRKRLKLLRKRALRSLLPASAE